MMAARPADIYGGIDYGKWKLAPVFPITFDTQVLPTIDIPGVNIPPELAQLWGVARGTAFPAAPATGALFYRTDHRRLYIYYDTRWVVVPGIPITETGILRVIVAVDPSVVFSRVITRGFPAAPVTMAAPQSYNAGAPLAVNSLYMFDVPVIMGDIVNFRVGGLLPVTIRMLDAHMIIMQGP